MADLPRQKRNEARAQRDMRDLKGASRKEVFGIEERMREEDRAEARTRDTNPNGWQSVNKDYSKEMDDPRNSKKYEMYEDMPRKR